ncbi:MAG: hypothetical protein ABMB14_25385 [Myxococcota bacterium]
MDPAIGVGLGLFVAMVFIGLVVGWWVFRKTLSLIRRLVMVGIALVLTLGAVGAVLAVWLAR